MRNTSISRKKNKQF